MPFDGTKTEVLTERQALELVATMLENEVLPFDMTDFCGTARCIGGHVYSLTHPGSLAGSFDHRVRDYVCRAEDGLGDLYWLRPLPPSLMHSVTSKEAAMATRNYLATGEPRWGQVFAATRGNGS